MNLRDNEEVLNINTKKDVVSNSISAKVLKKTSDTCSLALQQIWNEKILESCQFPENLKFADASRVFKQDKILTKIYWPVLPTLSKIFGKIMQKEVVSHVNTFLSPCLRGYRKGFSTQYALLSLQKRWKKAIDNKGFARGNADGSF